MNNARSETLLVVDPFSTALLFCKTAREQGVDVLAVITRSTRMWENFRISLSRELDATATIQAEHPEKAARLARGRADELGLEIVAVVPGGDASSAFAEETARLLDLPTQAPGRPEVRTSKLAAGARLEELGLAHIRSWELTSPDELARGLRRDLGEAFRRGELVAKPPDSSGTDKVFLCRDFDELARAAREILAEETVYVRRPDRVLVQERIRGPEYSFNTVSRDGRHKVISWWLYQKMKSGVPRPLYRSTMSLDPSREAAAHSWGELYSYCLDVLDGLGVREGAAHVEIFLGEDGPVLCELNPRLSGGAVFWFDGEREAQGYNAIDAWLMACLPSRRERWEELPELPPPQKVRYGVAAMRYAGPAGVLKSMHLETIENLATCRGPQPLVREGDTLRPTTSLLDFPGMVPLSGSRDEVVADVLRAHRILARGGVFEVDGDSAPQAEPPVPAAVFVEPASSAFLLQRRALEAGLFVVSILTLPEELLENDHSSVAEIPTCEIFRSRDVEEIVRYVDGLNVEVVGVFPGFEASLDIAEALRHRWGLGDEESADVSSRTTKSGMQAALERTGLRHARWVAVEEASAADSAVRSLAAGKNVGRFVVQPDLDAGSHHVRAYAEADAAAAFVRETLLHGSTLQASAVERVVVRERIEGKQYQVSGISHGGEHKVTGFWKYEHFWIEQEGEPGFETPFFRTIQEALTGEADLAPFTEYAFRVLDAIGHRSGAFSVEMIDAGGGPVLVEVNPRLPGLEGFWVDLQQRGLGYDALDLWLSTLEVPDALEMLTCRFEDVPVLPERVPELHWAIFFLRSRTSGRVRSLPGPEDLVERFQTLVAVHWYAPIGGALQPSRSLMEVPGYLVFAGEKGAVEDDLLRIRKSEARILASLLEEDGQP